MSTLIDKRRWWLIGLLLMTGALSIGVPNAFVPDNSLRIWFLEDDPELKEYDNFHKQFGNDEVILLHVIAEKGIFEHELLTRLKTLTVALEDLKGVHAVHSILSTRDAYSTGAGLAFRHIIPEPIPKDAAALDAARKRVVDNALFTDRLISADGHQTMLWIQMESMANFDNLRDGFVDEVSKTVAKHLDGQRYAMGGMGVIYTGLNKITQHDFGLFISLTYMMMFIILWWVFRSVRFMVATIGVISVGTIVCLGIYGLLDKHLNMVTILLPTLVIVLGIADAVHFPTAFLSELKKQPGDRLAALKAGLQKIIFPCVMTTVTTMAGFLALASSPMSAIRDLGIFAAIGVGAALLASVALMMPAFIGLKDGAKLPEFRQINGWLDVIARSIDTKPWVYGMCALILAGFAGYGALQLEADTYTLGYLPDEHPVVVDHHNIVKNWGDYGPLEYVIRAADGKRVDSPEVLNAMEAFIKEAQSLDGIRNGMSLATLFRRTQQAFAPKSNLERPFSGPLVAQLKVLTGDPTTGYEWNRSEPAYKKNIFSALMNQKATLARLTLVGKMPSAQEAQGLLDKLNVMAERHFKGLGTAKPGGYAPLYVKIIDHVIVSQTQGFLIALALILVLMLTWLRSLRLALISIIVNVFPVMVMLGTMFYIGQTLDIASATIAAIVLGISIDDTIHFMAHWRAVERKDLSWRECVDYTFEHAGKPAVITTVLLGVGFPILMFAQVTTVFYFGLLTTIAAFAALFADLVVLPLLLRMFPARRVV